MSQRRSILASEEGPATPGSPLRRSSRIANSPAPVPEAASSVTPASAISRRRNSADTTSTSSPAKVTRKRPSLSHEVLLENPEDEFSKSATTKSSRAASKSPTNDTSVATPARRGRRSSVSKIIEEETAVSKPPTPTRRRSVRGQSASPTRDIPVEPPTAKPRGRRASITQVSLEVIEESDKQPAPKVGRATRTSRRASIDGTNEDAELKTEEKIATRRTTRRQSIEVSEESIKPVLELNTITEEENAVETNDNAMDNATPDLNLVVEELTQDDAKNEKNDEHLLDENKEKKDELSQLGQNKSMSKLLSIEIEESEFAEKSPRASESPIPDSDLIFKSPARRSPRLLASPNKSPAKDMMASPKGTSEVKEPVLEENEPANCKLETGTESPQKLNVMQRDEDVKIPTSPRRSPRLSECCPDSPKNRPKRLSSSFSEGDSKEVTKPLNKDVLNQSLNDLNLKRAASPKELNQKTCSETFSDASFTLNVSIPSCKSTDNDDMDNKLDCSGSSNNSDKENCDKLNKKNSPKIKRHSLSETTSTPKLTKLYKVDTFLEPMEVEYSNDITVASAISKTPVMKIDEKANKSVMSLNNESIVEVDNENEFGTSPIKPLKKTNENLSVPSDEEIEKELMDSFVDEVIVDDEILEPEELKKEFKETGNEINVNSTLMEQNSKKSDAEDQLNEATTKGNLPNVETVDLCETDDAGDESSNENAHNDEAKVDISIDDQQEKSPVKNIEAKQTEKDGKNSPENVDKKGSKRRKLEEKKSTTVSLDDLINLKLQEVDDDDDEDYEAPNEFLDDMASEGEEDTPSEDSNEIIDEGESLHSSDSEANDSQSDEYENDSFIADDESIELLSGNEFDLEDLDVKNKKRSRIIQIIDSSDDENIAESPVIDEKKSEKYKRISTGLSEDKRKSKGLPKNDNQESKASLIKDNRKSNVLSPEKKTVVVQDDNQGTVDEGKGKIDIDDDQDLKKVNNISIQESLNDLQETKPSEEQVNNTDQEKPERSKKIVILQDIKLNNSNPVHDVVINEEDNLKSLESMKEKTKLEVPREPTTSLSTPNNSIIEATQPQRKSSISIQEQMQLSKVQDGLLNDKINNAVNYFVGSIIDKKRGNVSLNVSLEYEYKANSSTSDESSNSPKPNRVSLRKEDVENMNNVVDQILETTVIETAVKPKSKKKRISEKFYESIHDEYETHSDITAKELLPKAQRLSLNSKGKSEKNCDTLSQMYESIDDSVFHEDGKKKSRKNKKRLSHSLIEVVSQLSENEHRSPSSKQQLNQSLDNINSQQKGKKNKKVDNVIPDESLKKKKRKIVSEFTIETEPAKKVKTTSRLQYFPVDMLVEEEKNAKASKSEHEGSTRNNQTIKKKNAKKVKPSLPASIDYSDWQVDSLPNAKPSTKCKDKISSVNQQVETLKRKFETNDFKNQMIYDSKVKRLDSKDILKNKQKSRFVNRKK